MKLAFIKIFSPYHNGYKPSRSLTFDYLAESIKRSIPQVEMKVCITGDDVLRYKPDIVGISSTTVSYEDAKKFSHYLKQHGNPIIIIGGTHITALPETMGNDMDFAVIGEGEITIVELLLSIMNGDPDYDDIKGIAYKNGNSEIKITEHRPPIHMDDLPIPPVPVMGYEYGKCFSILTTRGCIGKCRHCSERGIWKPFRAMSPKRIVDIIELYHKQTGIPDVVYMDDLSVYNLKRVVGIRDELARRNLLGKVCMGKVSCNSELMTEEIADVMVELGIKLAGFGLESASPRILAEMKAGSVKVENFENMITWFGKRGVRTSASTVWGYPGETLDDMRLTRDFLKTWNGKSCFQPFSNYVCQPLPGSFLWTDMLDAEKVSMDMDFSQIQTEPVNLDASNWLYINDATSREDFVAFRKGELN